MKKLTVLALAAALIFFAGTAMADTIDVTANFGTRVTQQGVCELVGSTTLSIQSGDGWTDAAVITVELLGNARICGSFTYNMATANGDTYDVVGVDGQDFFTITVADVSGDGLITQDLVFGDVGSEICFDLSNTAYNSTNPAEQLVTVSYRDDDSNTYSGDIYVATVKPQAHAVALCTKTEVGVGGTLDGVNDFPVGGLANWGDTSDPEDINKDGLPEIALCFSASTDQSQVTTDCGAVLSATPSCITIDDTANNFNGDAYTFSFTIDKAGIGIRAVALYDNAGPDAGTALVLDSLGGAISYTLLDEDGNDITATNDPTVADEAVEIKTFTIDDVVVPAGEIIAVVYYAYDTCTATAGTMDLEASFNKLPCGDSFTDTITAVEFINCSSGSGVVSGGTILFPYFTDTNAAWWSGMALTNLSSSDQSYTVVIYEADGDMYTGTIDVVANGITAGIFSGNTYLDATGVIATFTTTSGDLTLGDERSSAQVTGSGMFHGFAMMGDGTQGQGYLPVVLP